MVIFRLRQLLFEYHVARRGLNFATGQPFRPLEPCATFGPLVMAIEPVRKGFPDQSVGDFRVRFVATDSALH